MRFYVLALVIVIGGCGDDDRPRGATDGGAGPSDAGGGGGGDVAIPTVTGTCSTAHCMADTAGGIAFLTFATTDCATAFTNPTGAPRAAGRGAAFSCTAGTCTTTSDDSPSAWEDASDTTVTTIPEATYGVIAWFDHNGNILMGGGPDLGDTLCCINAPVDSSTSSVNLLSTSCMDL